jgi:H2-forming N5,N10-methylenetetrahydromethanopterin dehydrogenase-like enzyme
MVDEQLLVGLFVLAFLSETFGVQAMPWHLEPPTLVEAKLDHVHLWCCALYSC